MYVTMYKPEDVLDIKCECIFVNAMVYGKWC